LSTRRSKVELYEHIRREYEHGAGTIRAVARRLGVHRREVRRLWPRSAARGKKPERERPKLAPALSFIDAILEADCRAPRKQRHTAHPHLDAVATGEAGDCCRRVHGARVCAPAQAGDGAAGTRGFSSRSRTSLATKHRWTGTRSLPEIDRPAAQNLRLLHALDGLRRGLSSGLSARHAAGIS